MSREIRIGILATASILLFIFGFQFLKGKNLFSRSQTYYISYDNVDQLKKSTPVLLNGFQVGLVQDIYQDPENLQKIIVVLTVNPNVQLPNQTVAELNTTSLMGGKAIILNLQGEECCLESGDYIEGLTLGMLNSMVGRDNVQEYMDIISSSFQELADTLVAKLSGNDGVGQTGTDLQAIVTNMRTTTALLNQILAKQGPAYQSLDNIQGITGNLENNNEEIASTLASVNQITADLQAAQLGNTVSELTATLTDLQMTLENANTALNDVAAITQGLKEGEGTLGMLLTDRGMYDQLDETLINLDLLLEDIRLHPKRYTRILSKKEQPYEGPVEEGSDN